MKTVTKEIVEKALSMRRDYTIAESAELLGVRAEELMDGMKKYVEGDGELPAVEQEEKPAPKKKGRKPRATNGARKKV